MLIINIVNSDGYMSGRETDVIFGDDHDDVIDRAYSVYLHLFSNAYNEHALDESADFVTKANFSKEMTKGMLSEEGYVVLQLKDRHYQFEPFCIEGGVYVNS